MTDNLTSDFGTGLAQVGMVLDLLRFSAHEAVDDIAPLLHPEMRVLAAPGIAPSHPYETREDFLEYFAEARRNGVLIEPDLREVRFSPTGAIVVSGSLRMTSRAVTAETPAWFVYTFRDGLILSLENHLSADMADEAAGIPVGARSHDDPGSPKQAPVG